MRPRSLGVFAVLLAACIPLEPEWLITAARFRGVRIEVVEPGGYASLLNVPPGHHRATVLPLDTVELEWFVAAPPGIEVPPPIWIIHSPDSGPLGREASTPACPEPLPFTIVSPCRLGEGHRIRVALGGTFTFHGLYPLLMIVGSRHADLTSATCLERLTTSPLAELEPCILARWDPAFGPDWATLPFGPETSHIPPEILAQDVDTNPDVLGFTVTRARGSARTALDVDVGASVGVRSGDRITVTPRLAAGSAQDYWFTVGDEKDRPWSGTLQTHTENLKYRAWFSAVVSEFGLDRPAWDFAPPTWVVPDNFEPTLLYLDVHDGRNGYAFAELLFVPDDAS